MSTSTQKPKLMVQNISCIIPETDSMGGLFVGNTYGAQNSDILKQYGIRAVLTTSIQTPVNYDPIQIPYHLKIEAHDKQNYAIIDHLDQCLEWIHKCRHATNVFVHCYAGVSRSVTIVVAYIMRYWKWSVNNAIAFVQAKRVVAKPNQGFMEQLKKFQQKFMTQIRPTSVTPQNKTSIPTTTTMMNTNPNPNTNTNINTNQNMYKTQNPSYQNSPNRNSQPQNPTYQNKMYTVPSLHNLVQNQSQNGMSTIRNMQQMHSTKRHSETPIPKILTNMQNKQPYNQDRRQDMRSPTVIYHSNSTNHAKIPTVLHTNSNNNYNNLNSIQSMKSTKALIRPKDLPGYKG